MPAAAVIIFMAFPIITGNLLDSGCGKIFAISKAIS
jgi:hypothetical protein